MKKSPFLANAILVGSLNASLLSLLPAVLGRPGTFWRPRIICKVLDLIQFKADRGDSVTSGPEMFAREIPLLSAQPGNGDRTLPLQESITEATGCLGGIAMHICTWSGIRCPMI